MEVSAFAVRTARRPDGHRARLRARLREAGPAALADHEMLEMVLFLVHPRRDFKPLAITLLRQFGSFAKVIAAPAQELRVVDGMSAAGAAALKLVQAAATRLAQAEVLETLVFNDTKALAGYLTAVLPLEWIEQFRVLFVDTCNRLLADDAKSCDARKTIPICPHDVAKRAVELDATAIILVHYNPGGGPAPSREEIEMMREVRAVLQPLSVCLQEYIIVGTDRHVCSQNLWLR